jgi:hypothetical protein
MSTSAVTLTPKRLFEGVWTAIIQTTAKDAPDLIVTHLEKPLLGVSLTQIEDSNQWELQVPVPVEAICDGVQTFLVTDAATNEEVGSFTLISGEALGDDIRAEMDLLRAELDMLKRAFRRHCLETL